MLRACGSLLSLREVFESQTASVSVQWPAVLSRGSRNYLQQLIKKDQIGIRMSSAEPVLRPTTATNLALLLGEDPAKPYMQAVVFTDNNYFNSWVDWVNDSSSSPTNTQKSNASSYTNAVIKIRCGLEAEDDACGMAVSEKGAYSIVADSTGSVASALSTVAADPQQTSNTFSLSAEQFTAFQTDKQTIDTSTASFVDNTSAQDPYFQFFYCGGSNDFIYACYKYVPAADADGYPRLGYGQEVTAFMYTAATDTLTEKPVTLNTSALSGLAPVATAMVALAVSLAS